MGEARAGWINKMGAFCCLGTWSTDDESLRQRAAN